jgi:hypothetical protein
MVGLLRSSNKTGFTICFTDILLASSVEMNENEIPETVEGKGRAMSIPVTVKNFELIAKYGNNTI